MPMFKVYVGNLDFKVTVEMLTPLFEPFGELEEISLAKDAEGKSRGFAIVLFRDPLKGQLAVETLTGRKIAGRTVVINEAVKKGKKTQPAVRIPRNTPLGPRAFPRVGGFGRGASGGGGVRGGNSARFIRNPRRLFNQPGIAGSPAAPDASGGPGSPAVPGTPGVAGALGPVSGPSSPGNPDVQGTHPAPAAKAPESTGPATPPAARPAVARPAASTPRPTASTPRPAAPAPRPATPAARPASPAQRPASPAPSEPPAAPARPRATKKVLPPKED